MGHDGSPPNGGRSAHSPRRRERFCATGAGGSKDAPNTCQPDGVPGRTKMRPGRRRALWPHEKGGTLICRRCSSSAGAPPANPGSASCSERGAPSNSRRLSSLASEPPSGSRRVSSSGREPPSNPRRVSSSASTPPSSWHKTSFVTFEPPSNTRLDPRNEAARTSKSRPKGRIRGGYHPRSVTRPSTIGLVPPDPPRPDPRRSGRSHPRDATRSRRSGSCNPKDESRCRLEAARTSFRRSTPGSGDGGPPDSGGRPPGIGVCSSDVSRIPPKALCRPGLPEARPGTPSG